MEKHPLKKYILYLLTINLFLLASFSLSAQVSFEDRKRLIDSKLESLSDSIIPQLNDPVDFSLRNASVQELIRGISETHRLNVSIDPSIELTITNSFNNARVKDVFLFLVNNYKIDIQFINNILIFKWFDEPVKPFNEKKLSIFYNRNNDKITLELNQDSLALLAKQITKITGKNIILSPETRDKVVNGYIQEVSVAQAMEKLAYMNAMVSEQERDYIILKDQVIPEQNVGRPNMGNNYDNRNNQQMAYSNRGSSGNIQIQMLNIGADTLYNINAINAQIKDVLEEMGRQDIANFAILDPPMEVTSLILKSVSLEELLEVLFMGSQSLYRQKSDNLYLVGNGDKQALNATEVIKVKFRSVEDLDTFIPENISRNLQLKVFKDLNAIIVSGSQFRIDELKRFVKSVDEPVPNIAIEVIVTEFRKGAAVTTGVKAFLGDSSVTTGGQVFPGLDVTLSSKSLNTLLGGLDRTGLVNLGRVTSNFYVTLQALEANNVLKVKSTPQLSTLNGNEANLTIGQSVYYLEQTQNVNPGVNPITTVSQQFNKVEANLTLMINPIVSGNDHITLTIEAEFSDFIPPEIEGAPPGNATRMFSSKIRVKNEEMIVLGGLEETSKSNSGSGVPFLSRIPGLKWLFSSRSVENNESELLIFIRPTVIW